MVPLDIGYARVSTAKQDLGRQIDALLGEGLLPSIFMWTRNPDPRHRPGLHEALDRARDGDVIVVHTLDRLGRTVPGHPEPHPRPGRLRCGVRNLADLGISQLRIFRGEEPQACIPVGFLVARIGRGTLQPRTSRRSQLRRLSTPLLVGRSVEPPACGRIKGQRARSRPVGLMVSRWSTRSPNVGELAGSHLLPSIRGEMLTRPGRRDETSPAPMQHKSGRNN
ncbi:MAG TPA: recombinase family protein [Arthrobacter sp.]|nr:recombinase family protein [Arthrobacter sp.]